MWRFLRHSNVLPLMGALMSGNWFAMVSEWMPNGNINQYIKARPEVNRLRLVRPLCTFASLASTIEKFPVGRCCQGADLSPQ